MNDCHHPYDETVETKLQSRYNNVPTDQIKARVCTDCGTIIDLDGRHNVEGTTFIIGKANTGCNHDRKLKKDDINIVDLSTNKVILSVETNICGECDRPVQPIKVDLREKTK